MAIVQPEELIATLRSYCNWASLPTDFLSSKADQTANRAAADDASLLTNFLQHLTSLVPFEWSVVQHRAFDNANSSSNNRLHPMMHAPAAATSEGIMCFGGVQLGVMQEVKVENEVSWIKETMAGGLEPDYSKVYQGTPSTSSAQVVRLGPSSSKPGAPWAAAPVSPPLDAGLLGHSVAVWGNRAFIFGGIQTFTDGRVGGAVSKRTVNLLRAFALDEAGTQGGMLPVYSDIPQMGEVPTCRMYHSAAVDPEGGVMYVYGGVTLHLQTNKRIPADSEAGLVHAFDFSTYTWSTLRTTGDHRPCSTTLLAFFWHAGSLWAIPDLPRVDQGGGRALKVAAAGYQLLRLCMDSKQWQVVRCQGQAPSQRMDSCSLYNPATGELLIYGGRQIKPPFALLADVNILTLPKQQDTQAQQQQQPGKPVWQQVQAMRRGAGDTATSGPQPQQQQQGMLPLAGHAGGVVGGTGEVVFVGGYRRNDLKEPQPLLQVLTKAVKPPTKDTAALAAVVPQQQLAMQHVRMQLAHMVKKAYPAQVLLKPEGPGVRLPARLLALYSSLFDDLFQEMLAGDDAENQQPAAAAAGPQQQQQQPIHNVPVPGVRQDSIAAVCRWMMGLLSLRSCAVDTLIDTYRVGDRLVMEQLMVEVLEELSGRELLPDEAAAVMQLAGDFPGAGDAVHRSAAQQLQQQVTPATAPAIMALARQQGNQALQQTCVDVMSNERKNDVFAVLDFALRFNLRSLQGSCLGTLRRVTRDRLVDKADRIMQVVRRRLLPGQDPSRVPAVHMLERDLVNEVEAADLQLLPSYASVCERLGLRMLWEGLVEYGSRQEVWQLLHQPTNKVSLKHLQQRHARLYTAMMQQHNRGARAPPAAGVADVDAALNLLGPAQPAHSAA